MDSLQTGKAPLAAAPGKKNPDVIVTHANETMLFQAQNRFASEWLHRRCGLTADSVSGDTEIRVHPRRCQNIVAELRAAGFIVANGKEGAC